MTTYSIKKHMNKTRPVERYIADLHHWTNWAVQKAGVAVDVNGVELKFDRKSRKTGNAYVEFETFYSYGKHKDDPPKPSGIVLSAKQAKEWVHVVWDNREWYCVHNNPKELLNHCNTPGFHRGIRSTPDRCFGNPPGFHTRGYIVPVDRFIARSTYAHAIEVPEELIDW